MCILARLNHNGNRIPIKVLDSYSIGDTKYASVETLDGTTPFLTIGSRVSKFTAWTNVKSDQLTDVHCTHENTVWGTRGGLHYSCDIGAWDDIEEYQFCLDCGQEIEVPEPVSPALEPAD